VVENQIINVLTWLTDIYIKSNLNGGLERSINRKFHSFLFVYALIIYADRQKKASVGSLISQINLVIQDMNESLNEDHMAPNL
jgi:hypothetical protein